MSAFGLLKLIMITFFSYCDGWRRNHYCVFRCFKLAIHFANIQKTRTSREYSKKKEIHIFKPFWTWEKIGGKNCGEWLNKKKNMQRTVWSMRTLTHNSQMMAIKWDCKKWLAIFNLLYILLLNIGFFSLSASSRKNEIISTKENFNNNNMHVRSFRVLSAAYFSKHKPNHLQAK